MKASLAILASLLVAPIQSHALENESDVSHQSSAAPIEILFYNNIESAQTADSSSADSSSVDSSPFDHSAFDILLQNHVKPITGSSAVDYAGFNQDRAALQAYLKSLSTVSQEVFDGWSLDHQLAFLINAYNAGTVELILTRYPNIKSIRQISSPWGKKFVSLFGENVSLDHIEHGLIRGDRYNEPRIHFAVNCASIGCPPLLNAAYKGEALDAQLEASTKLFLSDKSRNFYDGKRLNISKIFSWYRKDFEQGWGGADSLAEFLSLYKESLSLDEAQVSALVNGDIKIKSTSYDWDLNTI